MRRKPHHEGGQPQDQAGPPEAGDAAHDAGPGEPLMSRRRLLAGLLLSLVAPIAADAQQAGKVYRVGFLSVSTGGYETNLQHCPLKGGPNWQARGCVSLGISTARIWSSSAAIRRGERNARGPSQRSW